MLWVSVTLEVEWPKPSFFIQTNFKVIWKDIQRGSINQTGGETMEFISTILQTVDDFVSDLPITHYDDLIRNSSIS
jgi:hypothetical protein